MRFPKGRRAVAAVVAALISVGAVAAVGYRVLAPAEVDTVARGGYPPAVTPTIGVVGRLPVAPLIVDGRLRVYTAARQVYADQPVDRGYRGTPYWSYRRWPARLSGVVADGTTVVSHWSDGKLVALDARTGRVAWRADAPEPAEETATRRTGASTVWSPPGLFLARVADASHDSAAAPVAGAPNRTEADRTVLVVSGRRTVEGFALADGRRLWSTEADGRCRTDVGTTATGQLVALDRCAEPTAVEFRDVATGTPTSRWQPPGGSGELAVVPVGCATPGSRCRGLRTTVPSDASARGWLFGAGQPVGAPALDRPDSELAGDRVVGVADGVLTARDARTGAELWRRVDLGQVRIMAAGPDRVHLLTGRNDLVTLDPATGAERSRFPLEVKHDSIEWAPGRAYAADGYVAIERLREPVDPDGDDQRYFLMPEPVVLAAT